MSENNSNQGPLTALNGYEDKEVKIWEKEGIYYMLNKHANTTCNFISKDAARKWVENKLGGCNDHQD